MWRITRYINIQGVGPCVREAVCQDFGALTYVQLRPDFNNLYKLSLGKVWKSVPIIYFQKSYAPLKYYFYENFNCYRSIVYNSCQIFFLQLYYRFYISNVLDISKINADQIFKKNIWSLTTLKIHVLEGASAFSFKSSFI